MDATTKAKVLIICPCRLKTLCIREAAWITAPRGQQKDQGRALWYRYTSNLDISQRGTRAKLYWRLVAQYLFDETKHEIWILA